MEIAYLEKRQEKDSFAERAAEHFANNQSHYTYGEIKSGEYFALRFGMGEDCVVVFRIDDETPVNYQNIIKRIKDD